MPIECGTTCGDYTVADWQKLSQKERGFLVYCALNAAASLAPDFPLPAYDSTFVFAGSSTMSTAFGMTFDTLVLDVDPRFAGYQSYYNTAVPGYTLANIAADYPTMVYPHRPTADGGDGGAHSYLVVGLSTNDLFAGPVADLPAFLAAWDSYISNATDDGFRVVLNLMPPRWALPVASEAQRLDINEYFRASYLPWGVVDQSSLLPDVTNSFWYADGTHLSLDGRIWLARAIADSIAIGQKINPALSALSNMPQPYVGAASAGGAPLGPPGLQVHGRLRLGLPGIGDDGTSYLEATSDRTLLNVGLSSELFRLLSGTTRVLEAGVHQSVGKLMVSDGVNDDGFPPTVGYGKTHISHTSSPSLSAGLNNYQLIVQHSSSSNGITAGVGFMATGNAVGTLVPSAAIYAERIGSFGRANLHFGLKANSTNAAMVNAMTFYGAVDGVANVGIGTTTPASKLTVANGDAEVVGSANGLILTSPDATRWRITVDNAGTISAAPV